MLAHARIPGRVVPFALGVCIAPALAAQKARPDPRLAAVDTYIEKTRVEWKVPAIAVAIVKDDSVVFAKGYGTLEIGGSRKTDENTLFAIGSASKAFTTAALAMLVDEGKLRWNDPATKYLPSLQLPDPWVTRELTVRDLVTHRVGLDRADALWELTDLSRDEVLRRQRFLGRIASFRVAFGYNNNMFLAAGQIIPAVTDTSWDDFVRTRILEPLGMRRTRTSTKPLASMDNVATPHAIVDDYQVIPVPWHNIDNIAPAGSINSSAIEMAQWMRLQLAGGTYGGKRLIASKTLAELHEPQTVIPREPWLSTLSPVNHQLMIPGSHFSLYGMGWFLQDYRGRKVVIHGGAIDGMRAMVGMVPEERLGVVALTNLNPTSADIAIVFRAFDEYFGGATRDWSHEILQSFKAQITHAVEARAKAEAQRVAGTSPSLPLEKYVGSYADSAYGAADVKEEGDHLVMRYGTATGDLVHWHYDTFQVQWRRPTRDRSFVTFTIGADGNPASLRTTGIPELQRVKPAERTASAPR